jgi:TonB-linked SusC/RagA family outer membrane protein
MIIKRLLYLLILPLLLFTGQAYAQDKLVTGTVTDATGAPVANASVVVKGARSGTSTAANGSFSIRVPSSATTLTITSIGYGTREISITPGPMSVSLTQTNAALNEVVVVGYGTQRRKDVTSSIARIGSDKIADVPSPSFESALAGKAAGVQVTNTSGLAGSGAIIRIRGINSISIPGDPLYVIDGLPIDVTYVGGRLRNTTGQDRNPLANINPNDIESVEILKDAGAAGIYGSRGANGVVLITTKRGRGKLTQNFTARLSVSGPTVKPKLVDKNTWLAIRQEAWELDGNTGPQQNLPGRLGGFPLAEALASPGTDWWDLATRTGFSQDYNYSISKGVGKFNFYVGGNYSKDQSYIIGNDYQRAAVRANIDYKPIKNLTLSLNSSFSNGINFTLNNAWNGGIGLAMSTGLPYYPLYNTDGSYFRAVASGGAGGALTWPTPPSQPFTVLYGNNLVNQRENTKFRNRENRWINSLSLRYSPIKNLDLGGSFTYEESKSLFNSYWAPSILNRVASAQGGGENNLDTYKNLSYNFTANYIWDINTDNRITILLGTEYQDQKTLNRYTKLDSLGTPLYKKSAKNIFTDSSINAAVETTSFNRLFRSLFTRINYSYQGKYILQGSLRRDESSVFRANNTAALFPTVSGAWVASQETFLKDVSFLNLLKLRTSWGLVGTSNIPWNAGYPNVNAARAVGDNYDGNPTIYRSNLGNPDLKWETSSNIDVAVEVGILKNRINFELGYYHKKSKDVLLEVPVSQYNGIGDKQWINQGSILNEGIEFNLNTINVKTKEFSWTSNFNIAHNYNEVLSIGDLRPDALGGGTNETRIVPGYPVGTVFSVRYVGVDPADGLPIFLDAAGKQTKVLNSSFDGPSDRVPIANMAPLYSGGFTNTFKYKNFELNTVFTYQSGGHIWDNSGKRNMGWVTDWNIYSTYVGNYWRKPGDIAKYPRPTIVGYPTAASQRDPWLFLSSMNLFKSDYVRLKELTISYSFPRSVLDKIKISNAKLYLTGYNLLLFTEYPNGDPETGRDGENNDARNQSGNANFLNPPLQRSLTFGLNISF